MFKALGTKITQTQMLASRCSWWVGKKEKQNTKIKCDKERPYLIDYKVEREPKSKGLKLGTVGVVRKAFPEKTGLEGRKGRGGKRIRGKATSGMI